MKIEIHTRARLLVTALALALLAALPLAAQKTAKEAEHIPEFERYALFHRPGEDHAPYEALVGTWRAELTTWMHGSPPPKVLFDATLDAGWLFDGRYLRVEFDATGPGDERMEGLYLFGYDTREKRHFNILFPHHDVLPVHANGTYDPEKRSWRFTASEHDPVTGDTFGKHETFTLEAADRLRYELRYSFVDGSEIRAAEAVYKRAGSAPAEPAEGGGKAPDPAGEL